MNAISRYFVLFSVVIFALCMSVPLSIAGTRAESPEEQARIWEKYATNTYGNLNTKMNGALSPIFKALGDLCSMYQYFDQENYPDKYVAYRELFVQALADSINGDVGKASFSIFLLEATPSDVVLRIIAPEIGPQGRLQGILDSNNDHVAKRIEQRSHFETAPGGNINFYMYVHYLMGKRMYGIADAPNTDVIIAHMFRVAPQNAFTAMLEADYGFKGLSGGYAKFGKEGEEVRRLQQIQEDISHALFYIHYSFLTREENIAVVKKSLCLLSEHDKWWIRLFVVCLMEKEQSLRLSDVIEKLSKDDNKHVRDAIDRVKKELANYPDQ